MSTPATAVRQNGDLRTTPEEYRRAVKASMRKTIRQNGQWVDVPPTDEEVGILLLKAAEYRLNPLKGQIYATWRGGVMRVETTLDGLRVLAQRTNEYRGQTKPEWYDSTVDKWTDVWDDDERPPMAARVGIRREGFPEPVYVTVHWSEFKQTTNTNQLASMWKEKPAHMLAKTSTSLGLRAAFPDEAGGLYTAEEMAGIGQVEAANAPGEVPQPAPTANEASANGNGTRKGSPGQNGNRVQEAQPEPATVVDSPNEQPSGPPATPETSGRLTAVLEKAGYSRLREDLARLVFDQQSDRLTEEQTASLANALTAAETAGITAVELERACKSGLQSGAIKARRKQLFDWVIERARQAGKEIQTKQVGEEAKGTDGETEPTAEDDGDTTPKASDLGPARNQYAAEAEAVDEFAEAATEENEKAEGERERGDEQASPDDPPPSPDADGGPATTVDGDSEAGQ